MSIRYGPHVVGRYTADGEPSRHQQQPESRGKDGPVETVENQKQVSHRSHRPLEIPNGGIPTFPPLRLTSSFPLTTNQNPKTPFGKPKRING